MNEQRREWSKEELEMFKNWNSPVAPVVPKASERVENRGLVKEEKKNEEKETKREVKKEETEAKVKKEKAMELKEDVVDYEEDEEYDEEYYDDDYDDYEIFEIASRKKFEDLFPVLLAFISTIALIVALYLFFKI